MDLDRSHDGLSIGGLNFKKGANNSGADGMAYRVYGCGIMKDPDDPIVVGLESTVVLPK